LHHDRRRNAVAEANAGLHDQQLFDVFIGQLPGGVLEKRLGVIEGILDIADRNIMERGELAPSGALAVTFTAGFQSASTPLGSIVMNPWT
jgi:hypothetical protein